MTRTEAEVKLQLLFGFQHFHDLQWQVIEQLLAGKRILLIEKTGFGKSLCFQFPATQLKGITIAMVVIDEAHCISIWGQSFRPNYRRIVNLVKLLPKNFPVLAATATATPRVQADIIEQVGSDLIPLRGQLLRFNLGLFVVHVQTEDEKFFWLAEYLPKLSKPGIIYTGTQANTDIFSNWLHFLGFNSAAYSGRLDADSRIRIEQGFNANQYDCVVATNALGMGIDKPDIRFIIHTQITQSPIHYYQEIGRAGRDNKKAFAIGQK